jgi:hypothetical protein
MAIVALYGGKLRGWRKPAPNNSSRVPGSQGGLLESHSARPLDHWGGKGEPGWRETERGLAPRWQAGRQRRAEGARGPARQSHQPAGHRAPRVALNAWSLRVAGLRARADSTYPARVVPAAGARVPRVRHGADCAAPCFALCLRGSPMGRPERTTHAGRGRGRALPPSPCPHHSPRAPPARALRSLRAVFWPRLCTVGGPVVTRHLQRKSHKGLLFPPKLMAHSSSVKSPGNSFFFASYLAISQPICGLNVTGLGRPARAECSTVGTGRDCCIY